jgi:hypothetical protein
MARIVLRGIACAAVLIGALGLENSAHAQAGLGTWVRQAGPQAPGQITMTVEACCDGGRRLTYQLGDTGHVMIVESPFDGREVPVLLDGKPSGETMAIKRLDDHHTFTVVKMNGKEFGTSKASLSPDGKTITVENDFIASLGGNPAGKRTEVWVRK